MDLQTRDRERSRCEIKNHRRSVEMSTTAQEVLDYTTKGITDPANMCIALEKAGEYAGCVGKKNADLKDVASRIQGIAAELRWRLACDSKKSSTLAGRMGNSLPSQPQPPSQPRPGVTLAMRRGAILNAGLPVNPSASASAAALSMQKHGVSLITGVPITPHSPPGGSSSTPTPQPNQQQSTHPPLSEQITQPPTAGLPVNPSTSASASDSAAAAALAMQQTGAPPNTRVSTAPQSPSAKASNGSVAGVAKTTQVSSSTTGNRLRKASREGNILALFDAEKNRTALLRDLAEIKLNNHTVSFITQLAEDENKLNKKTDTDDINDVIADIRKKYATQLAAVDASKKQSGGRRSRRNKGHKRRRVTRK